MIDKFQFGFINRVLKRGMVAVLTVFSISFVSASDTQINSNTKDVLREAGKLALNGETKLDFPRAWLLRGVADFQIRAGDPDGAYETLKRLREMVLMSDKNDTALRSFFAYLGELYATLGDVKAATDVLDADPDQLSRSNGYYKVSNQFAKMRNFAMAKQLALRIPDLRWKAMAFQALAVEYAKVGDFQNALAMADSITSPGFSTIAYLEVAHVLTDTNNKREILGALDKAFEKAKMTGVPDDFLGLNTKETLFIVTARAYAKTGDVVAAERVAAEQGRGCLKATGTDTPEPALCVNLKDTYAHMAEALAEANNVATAYEYLKKAQDSIFVASALKAIAMAEARAGRHTEALNTGLSIKDPYKRRDSLLAVTEVALEQGESAAARVFALAIDNPVLQARALLALAIKLLSTGRWQEANLLADEAAVLAKNSLSFSEREDALATAYAIKRQHSEAEAKPLFTMLREESRWLALLRSARLFANAGQLSDAVDMTRAAYQNELSQNQPGNIKIESVTRERVRYGDRESALADVMNIKSSATRAYALLGLAEGDWPEPRMPLQTPRK